MKIKKGHKGILTWEDSASPAEDTWMKPDAVYGTVEIHSYGEIVLASPRSVTIAGHISEFGRASGAISVPRSCIKGWKRIK